jgi:hypothetical protein
MKDIPRGVSKWKNYGKKWGYWEYFEKQIRAEQHTISFSEGYKARSEDLPKSYQKGKVDGIGEMKEWLLNHGHGGGILED